jgi:polyketide cyclase/dehydrase/lipid transport protein
MERRIFSAVLLAVMGAATSWCAAESPIPDETSGGWKLSSNRAGIMLYSRARAGSFLREFKAVGEIDASSRAVHNVVDDVVAYPDFMPFTKECRIIKREGEAFLAYQRLSPRIVCDRDYTLRIRKKSWPAQGGLAYLNQWESANDYGPAETKGVLRVKLCEGSWLIEPSGLNKSRATYSVCTDSGGALPVFVANAASEIGIRKIFTAVRNQVKLAKYSAD